MKISEPARRVQQLLSIFLILLSGYYLSGSTVPLETALASVLFLMGAVSWQQSSIIHLENRVSRLE